MGWIILYYFYRIKIKHCSVLICYFHSLKVTRMQEPRSLNFFQCYALRPPTMVSCGWWPFLDYCCNTSKLSKSTFQKKTMWACRWQKHVVVLWKRSLQRWTFWLITDGLWVGEIGWSISSLRETLCTFTYEAQQCDYIDYLNFPTR